MIGTLKCSIVPLGDITASSPPTTDLSTTTTFFVGAYYEVTDPETPQQTITKYYYAGTQRIATLAPHCVRCSAGVRSNGTLYFTLGDHLGSTNVMVGENGEQISELRYGAWGEVRYPADGQNPGPSEYTYTGQYSNMDDFGLMFYNARFYSP